MTTAETIDATAVPILEIGPAWMLSPATAAAGADLGLEGFADAAATWGRRAMAGVGEGELRELATLTRLVAEGAEPSVGSLFAGWRALARPEDAPGEVTVLLNVLRELRGGAHLSAVQAAGLGAVGAIVSFADPVRGGSVGADRFGWPAPHPTPSPERRAQAEAMTTVICEPAYDVLDAHAQARLVELVLLVRAAIDE